MFRTLWGKFIIKLHYKYSKTVYCWSWLLEERVDEFVIEKYIEINKGISIQILALIMLQYNRSDIEHVHIFIAKDVKKKVNLVTLAEGNKKQQ